MQDLPMRLNPGQDLRSGIEAPVRALIRQADAKVIEEWKWDIPVWSRGGIISTPCQKTQEAHAAIG